MKKQLLVAAFAAITSVVAAQSSFTINDNNLGVMNGGTYNFWVSASVTDSRIYSVANVSASNQNVKVRKSVLQINDAGSTTWFCTDQNCYAPSTQLSNATTMGASGGAFDLTIDFNPNGVVGTGVTQVRYSIINQSNPADSAWFVIVYNISNSPTGVAANVNVKPTVSNPMPNPASTVFTMNYKLGSATNAKLVVYNMLGAVVIENPVTDAEGAVRMDVSTLEQGVYFCTLESDGKALATRRLVVSH